MLGALDAAVVGKPRVHRETGDGEPREQVLRVGDHREVHEPASRDRDAREFRPRLLVDRAVRLAHLAQVALGRAAAFLLGEDLGGQFASLEVVPEALEPGHARLELAQPLALGVRDLLGLTEPFVRDLEPVGAVGLEFRELLLALRVLDLALELGGELLELLAAGAPQGLQPEMHQRIDPALGISEQHFELLELLLQPRVRVLLLLELVAEVVQLVVEVLELLLELGAVPEQLEQPLLLGRVGLADRGQLQLRPLVRKHDRHWPCSGGRHREAVTALDAVFQPLVEQHVAGPALAAARRQHPPRACATAGARDRARYRRPRRGAHRGRRGRRAAARAPSRRPRRRGRSSGTRSCSGTARRPRARAQARRRPRRCSEPRRRRSSGTSQPSRMKLLS